METPTNITDNSQESKTKRSPILIIILVLLLLMVVCCITVALTCWGSGRLPDFLDRLSEYGFDPYSYNGDFWGLVTGPEGSSDDPNGLDPFADPKDMEATPTLDSFMGLTSCPAEPTEFYLEIAHTWDYSPNRDLASMKIDGLSEPNWQCPLTIDGSNVDMEPCQFPISSEGFVQTDAGPCSVTGAGYAIIKFDDPYCEDGKLVTRIIESIDADAESTGEMVCPGVTQPSFPFFPHSNTPEVFIIQPGGDTQNEYADPEIMNQFKYDKNWTLGQ